MKKVTPFIAAPRRPPLNYTLLLRERKLVQRLVNDLFWSRLSKLIPDWLSCVWKIARTSVIVGKTRLLSLKVLLRAQERIFSNYWMRLSRIWRILQIKEGVIHRGRWPRWITPSLICRILHILRKPNSMIALLFIQNISSFLNEFRHYDICFSAHQI